MKQEFGKTEMKEAYVAPKCECIEVSSEGILCSSADGSNDESSFGSEGDIFGGEW